MKSHNKNSNNARQRARIEKLKQKIREVTGKDPVFGTMADYPPGVEEAFLKGVLAFESAPKGNLWDGLVQSGVTLPMPEDLSDGEIHAKLWEVIHALLARRFILCNTDHLSDREMYTHLWNETLHEDFVIAIPKTTRAVHIDMTESKNYEEGLRVYL